MLVTHIYIYVTHDSCGRRGAPRGEADVREAAVAQHLKRKPMRESHGKPMGNSCETFAKLSKYIYIYIILYYIIS